MPFSEVAHGSIHVVLGPPRDLRAIKGVTEETDVITHNALIELGKGWQVVVHVPGGLSDVDCSGIRVVLTRTDEGVAES